MPTTRQQHSSDPNRLRRCLAATWTAVAVALVGLVVGVPAHAATITVNSAADSVGTDAACTLREAIVNVNAAGDATGGDCAAGTGAGDDIAFNIPGSGVHTIIPATALPPIIQPVHIDGYSQPGASPNTQAVGSDATLLIELDGVNASFNADQSLDLATGLQINAGPSSVRGLVINNFTNDIVSGAIVLSGATNCLIQGNYLGTDAAGTDSVPNDFGVRLEVGAANNVIGTDGDGVADAAERNVISGATFAAVQLRDSGTTGNRIAGNYIGSDAAGTAAVGNGWGVFLEPGAVNNVIGTDGDGVADGAERNVIFGNSTGVALHGSGTTGNHVSGNFIGIDATGTAAMLGGMDGVVLEVGAANNVIGTDGDGVADTAERNVISGGYWAVLLRDSGTTGNRVAGNYIGTDPAGSASVPNAIGVVLDFGAARNVIGTDGDGVADDTERNVISSNTDAGVALLDNGTDGNRVAGNYIGTDATGMSALPNGAEGVRIARGASGNTIGGTRAALRNIVSGNQSAGILIHGSATIGNRVQGNFIGVAADGATPLGNTAGPREPGWGIAILSDSTGNEVGGTAAGAGNIIAHNAADGVLVLSGIENFIVGNRIFSNGGLGIDLGGDGITANDPRDRDLGANQLQNSPELRSVVSGTLSGSLDSTPRSSFRLEFFASSGCDPSGNGEGEIFLGAQDETTNAGGKAMFSFAFTPIPGHDFIAATATHMLTGDTSEFSTCVRTRRRPPGNS